MNPCMLFYQLLLDLEPYLSDVLFYNLCSMYKNKKYNSKLGFKPKKIDIPEHAGFFEFKAISLLNSVFNKLVPEQQQREPDEEALMVFLESNEQARKWNPKMLGKRTDPVRYRIIHMIVDSIKFELYKVLYMNEKTAFSVSSFFEFANTGPGKSAGCASFDFFSKMFCDGMTTSSQSLHKLYCAIVDGTSWGVAETRRNFNFGPPTVKYSSTMFYAPKNCEVSRAAGTEPSLNMVFQLWIGGYLQKILRTVYGIDIQHQQLANIQLARLGSLYGTYATIDLKSASNFISIALIKLLFPPVFFEWLMFVRTPFIKWELPKGKKANEFLSTKDNRYGNGLTTVNMMGTMGNGFTFPLQTLLFTILLKHVYIALGIKLVKTTYKVDRTGLRTVDVVGNYGVFGDDIIVLKEAYDLMIHMLGEFGLVVNDKKTFSTGYFRESCGGDYYVGKPVRPFFIKKMGTPQELYIALNSSIEWSASNNMPLPRFTRSLYSMIPPGFAQRYVPRTAAIDSGIRVPEPYLPIRFLRYKNLHGHWSYEGYEVDKIGFQCERIVSTTKVKDQIAVRHPFSTKGYTAVFTYSKRKTDVVSDNVDSEIVGGNPYGYLISALRGDVKGGFYMTRQDAGCNLNYSSRRFTTHSWVGSTSYFDETSRTLVFMSPDESMALLGLCCMSDWKRLFDIYELIR